MSNPNLTPWVVLVTTVILSLGIAAYSNIERVEHFDYAGLTLTRPPPWWFPQTYDAKKWFSVYHPDQLQQPNCVSKDRGDPRVLNYESSSYRFWRF
jgi:hypothetical protein